MKISISGRKVNLKENFKDLAKKKLSRFDRIFKEDAEANVVVTVERNHQIVEITIQQPGMMCRAEASNVEMNDALDQVISSLGRQIRKNKTKLEKEIHSEALDKYVQDYLNTEEPADESEYKIVRTKHFFVKPLSVEEAILQMNLLEHQFFMFRDVDSGEINVVYKRKNGDYGLLEPDVE